MNYQIALRNLIKLLFPAFLLLTTSCVHMHMSYEGKATLDGVNDVEFTYKESYKVSRFHRYGCLLTFWFWGGWCWSYAVLPNGPYDDTLRSNSTIALHKKTGRGVDIVEGESALEGWSEAPKGLIVRNLGPNIHLKKREPRKRIAQPVEIRPSTSKFMPSSSYRNELANRSAFLGQYEKNRSHFNNCLGKIYIKESSKLQRREAVVQVVIGPGQHRSLQLIQGHDGFESVMTCLRSRVNSLSLPSIEERIEHKIKLSVECTRNKWDKESARCKFRSEIEK